MESSHLALLMFVALLLLVFLGHPLAITLGGLAVIFGWLGLGSSCFGIFAGQAWGMMAMERYVLVAIPLFIFMAQMLHHSGIAERLYDAMHIVLGRLRGGLLLATIIVCTVFAATTGIIGASVVAMGLLAAPAMLKRGYQKEIVSGAVCAGGTLGILIPPSIMLVVYGGMAGLPPGRLFAGALLPGLVLSGLYMSYIAIRCFLQPKLAPPPPKGSRTYSASQKLFLVSFSMLPPLGLIVAVLGSILFGIANSTEAAGTGAVGSVVLALFYRKLSWPVVKEASLETLKTTAMVMLLFIGGSCFSAVFLALDGGTLVKTYLLAVENRWITLGIMMVVVFFLGMFIDWLGILLVCIPVFGPIAAELGFHPLWFALVVCVNLQMSFLTPPFGYALFYFKGVAPPDVRIGHIYRGIVPFVLLQMLGLLIVILVPQLVTWLPELCFGPHR